MRRPSRTRAALGARRRVGGRTRRLVQASAAVQDAPGPAGAIACGRVLWAIFLPHPCGRGWWLRLPAAPSHASAIVTLWAPPPCRRHNYLQGARARAWRARRPRRPVLAVGVGGGGGWGWTGFLGSDGGTAVGAPCAWHRGAAGRRQRAGGFAGEPGPRLAGGRRGQSHAPPALAPLARARARGWRIWRPAGRRFCGLAGPRGGRLFTVWEGWAWGVGARSARMRHKPRIPHRGRRSAVCGGARMVTRGATQQRGVNSTSGAPPFGRAAPKQLRVSGCPLRRARARAPLRRVQPRAWGAAACLLGLGARRRGRACECVRTCASASLNGGA